MNVEVVQRRLWEQPQQHREHRASDTPLFPINKYDGRVQDLMDLTTSRNGLRQRAPEC